MKFLFRRRSTDAPQAVDVEAIDGLIAEGNRLEDGGDAEAARKLYAAAVAQAPESWRAHLNLGNALKALGRLREAVGAYRAAIALHPEFAGAHLNLGTALAAGGNAPAAAESYRKAIALRPDWAEAWFGLACALERVPRGDEAIEAYERALALDPAHAMAAAALAALHTRRGEAHEARRIIDGALARHPADAHVLVAAAELAKQNGDACAAIDAYRKALASNPEDAAVWSAYLFALNFDERIDAGAILAEHRRYGERLASRAGRVRARDPDDPDRRLRIGYVSPDFRRHSVSCFVEPLLRHHDRALVEVHCYYNHAARDDITTRFMGLADGWHDIAGVDDETVARRIADDAIDVLVDLAGHTTANRLGVFARKPAPVQYTWLGYLCTTGLEAIDYRLCDAQTDPPGVAEAWQVETPARLPVAQWCYQPQAQIPEPSPLPRASRGHWTFGSFNQATKLGTEVLNAWADVLAAIPDSRLRIVGVPNAMFEENALAIFAARGVAAERLDLIGRIPIEDYFSSYGEVDIALDSFPYNGATTTCDALLTGVPVATVAGSRSISRGGVSLLRAVGLDDWIAASRGGLVPLLLRQTRDPDALATLRAELPSRMRASPLMDGPRFARDLEAIYREAWVERCASAR